MAAPILPTELWLRVVDHLRKPIVYYVGDSCCGGAFRPAPGSSFGVGPLRRPADKDCISLSSTCVYFRDLLSDEVAFGELHVCLRDGQLVRHSGGRYPVEPVRDRLVYTPLHTAPFGSNTRRLTLSLFVYEGFTFPNADHKGLDATADAVVDDVIAHVPNVVALEIHVRVGHIGNAFSLPEKFVRAISTLPMLVDLTFSGCYLPTLPDLRFPRVRRVQTDHIVSSFEHFPSLRELRNDQHWLEQDAYKIPPNVFRKLEVVHYCPPDNTEAIDWFTEDCVAMRTCVRNDVTQIRMQELVLRHSIDAYHVEQVIKALASVHLRTFVCYGLYRDYDRYDQLLALAKRAFPRANIDFVDYRDKKLHKH